MVLNYIKSIMAEDELNNIDEEEDLKKRRFAFAKLMELREEFAKTNPKSFEEERFESMAEKYPFLKDDREYYVKEKV